MMYRTIFEVRGSKLWRQILAGWLSTLFVFVPAAQADSVADLSSTARNNVAPSGGTIRVGNEIRSVQAGDVLTDAEHLALQQILDGGRQSLIIGGQGNATGGQFNVNDLTGDMSGLVIPKGVTALQDIAGLANLNMSGDLKNFGNFYLFSSTASASVANIAANNVYNHAGAILSTALPQSLSGGLAGNGGIDLSLTALQSIINAGLIRSSGNLSLSAGTTISNTGVVEAANNINLISSAISNANLINSIAGDINISSAGATNIALSNTGGTIQALLGSINVRDTLFSAKANFTMTGGNVLSEVFNIHSGNGIVDLKVNNISGLLNLTAGEAHVAAAGPMLNLGEMNITGDPTFYNQSGSVSLSSDKIFNGQALAIVARGDILSSVVGLKIDTSFAAGNGGAITLVAGANFTLSAPDADSNDELDVGSTLTITGGSVTGGKIDLKTNAISQFSSASDLAGGSGGNVTLIAYKGLAAGSGSVLLPATVQMDVTGGDGGQNGNVLMIAGSTVPLSVLAGTTVFGGGGIQSGGILANGANTIGGGNISLYNATPTMPAQVAINSAGQITSGNFAPGALTAGGIAINSAPLVSGELSAFGDVEMKSKGAITVENITSGGDVTLHAGSPLIQVFTSSTAKISGLTVGHVFADAIEMKTTGGNASITLNGNVVAQNDVTIEAHGKGSILALNRTIDVFQQGTGPGATSFPLGPENTPAFLLGAIVSKDGTTIFVPDYSSAPDFPRNTVTIIDAVTGALLGSISGFDNPQGTALSPDGSKLYVTNAGNGTVSIVDVASKSIIATVSLGGPAGNRAELVAVSPSGDRFYVLSNAHVPTNALPGNAPVTQTLTIIDATSNTIIDTVDVGTSIAQSGGLVINPTGTIAYVSSSGDKKVYAVDLLTNSVIGSPIDLSSYNKVSPQLAPYALAMDPTGTRLYVGIAGVFREDTNKNGVFERGVDRMFVRDGHIAVIDTTRFGSTFNKVVASVKLPTAIGGPLLGGSFPQGLAVNPTGMQLMVQSTYIAGVSSVYTGPNQVLEFIGVAPNKGPDGFGSTAFSALVHVDGVPVIRTFTSNTQNLETLAGPLPKPNNISVIQQGTVMGDNITLKSGGGNIILNYALRDNTGVITANTGGTGAILLGNVSDGITNVGPSGAANNFFEIGSIHGMNITGAINSPRILLHTSDLNANIALNANVGKVGSIIDIKTVGSGAITQAQGNLIIGKTINLVAGGNIGASGLDNQIDTVASNLSISTQESAFIKNSGILTLGASGARQAFELTNAGTVTVFGAIVAPDIKLSMTNNGSLILGAQVGKDNTIGNEVWLSLNGTGTLTNKAGSFRVVSDSFKLESEQGNVASAFAPLRLAVNRMSVAESIPSAAYKGAPSMYFHNDGNLQIDPIIMLTNQVSAPRTNTLAITANGSMTVVGEISGMGNLNLNASDITIKNNINAPEGNVTVGATQRQIAAGTTKLTTSGGNVIFDAGSTINVHGGKLIFDTKGGDVKGNGSPLQTTARSVTFVSPAGVVDIASRPSADAVVPMIFTVGALTADSATFKADGQLIVAGAIKAPTVILRTEAVSGFAGASRDITLRADVGLAGSGTTALISPSKSNMPGAELSSTNVYRTGGAILAEIVTLEHGDANDTGSFGKLVAPILTKASTLNVNAGASGSVFLSNYGDVVLGTAIATNGTFNLVTTGSLANPGAINVSAAITQVKDLLLQTKANNASINYNADISASDSITLNASGKGNINSPNNAVSLNAPIVALVSGAGNIGALANPIRLNAGTVTAKTTGTGDIALHFVSDGVLGASSASTVGGDVEVTSSSGADVTIGGLVTAATISIASAAAIFGSASPLHSLNGKIVELSSAVGNIGADANNRVLTRAGTLSVIAASGNAFIQNIGTLKLANSSTANVAGDSVLDVKNTGATVISGNIVSDNLSLYSTGMTTQPDGSFELTGNDSLTLGSISGAYGTATRRIKVDTPVLTTSTKGAVFVENTSAAPSLSVNGYTGSTFNLITNGVLSIEGAVSAPLVSLNAGGAIARGNTAVVAGTNVNLSAGGDIGSSGTPFLVNAVNLSVSQAGGVSDAFIEDTVAGVLNLTGASPHSNQFTLTNNGNVSVKVPITADTININSGTGAVSTALSGSLNGGTVALNGAGNLGTAFAPIKTQASNVSANSSAGSVGILNSVTPLSLNNSSSAKDFTLKDTSGSLTVAGTVTVGLPGDQAKMTNNLKLIESGNGVSASIQINNDLHVTGGSITVNNANTGDGSLIAFGANTDLLTEVLPNTFLSNGRITVAIGALPIAGKNPLALAPPANVNVVNQAPGVVYGGQNPNVLSASGPTPTTLHAKGRDVIFNSTNPNSAITFGDAVTITADPPPGVTVSGASIVARPAVASMSNAPEVSTVRGITPLSGAIKFDIPWAPGNALSALDVVRSNISLPDAIGDASFESIDDGYEIQLYIGDSLVRPVGKGVRPVAYHAGVSATSKLYSDLHMPAGAVLFVPVKDTVIATSLGSVTVKKNAVVMVVAQQSGVLSVYNFHDARHRDVVVTVDNQEFFVEPGSHLTIARGEATEFAEVNAVPCIAHRDVRTAVQGDFTVFSSEFSIASAVKGLKVLSALATSSDSAQKHLVQIIIKNAAIMMQMRAKTGPYRRIGDAKPRLTAMQ